MGLERVQFVDSITATAGVRLSLTDAPWSVLFSGTDVSPPALRRAVNSTLLSDGAQIPAAAYENRELNLHVQMDSSLGQLASALQVQKLRRELDRPANILRWQPDPSLPPVYFKTFRAPDSTDIIDHGINLHEFTLVIPAEPFSYGHQEVLSAAVVANDPNASNGRYFDLTGIKGDVETPLRLTIPGASVVNRQSLLSVRRRGTPGSMPFLLQAESLSQGDSTSVVATSDGAASPNGAASNTSTTSFAVNNNLTVPRLSTSAFPAAASVDNRGTYRVFARVRAATSTTYTMKIDHGQRVISNETKTVVLSSNVFSMVDLGLIQMPEGVDPVTDGPGGNTLSVTGVQFRAYAQRITGSAALLWDYFLFVPADDSLMIVNWGSFTPTTFVLDGITKAVYGLNASGQIADIAQVSVVGLGWPTISPGVTNRIVYINDVTPNPSTSDPVANTVTVNGSYWPRYLAVGTGA